MDWIYVVLVNLYSWNILFGDLYSWFKGIQSTGNLVQKISNMGCLCRIIAHCKAQSFSTVPQSQWDPKILNVQWKCTLYNVQCAMCNGSVQCVMKVYNVQWKFTMCNESLQCAMKKNAFLYFING